MLQSINSVRRAAYKRFSLYVGRRQLRQINRLADIENWEESDLIRALLALGLCEELRDAQKLEPRIGHGPVFERKKAFQRAHHRGVIISARLPAGLAKILDTYAHGLGISRNEAVVNLVQLGTATYCETQLRLFNSLSKSGVS